MTAEGCGGATDPMSHGSIEVERFRLSMRLLSHEIIIPMVLSPSYPSRKESRLDSTAIIHGQYVF